MRARTMVATWILLVLQGCGAPKPDPGRTVVTDSAGVELVAYDGDRRTDERWNLMGTPTLQLGTRSDSGPESFFRITSVAVDRNRVYVANMGTDELRVFDRRGRYLGHMGRHGFGPGEFTRLALVDVVGANAVLTYSGGTDRFVVFDTLGRIQEEFRTLEGVTGLSFPAAVLADTQIVVADVAAMPQLKRTGLVHDSATLSLFTASGIPVRRLDRIPFGERVVERVGNRISVGSPTFSPSTLMGSSGVLFCYTTATAFQFQCMDARGVIKRIVRWPRSPQRVTAEDIAVYTRQEVQRASPERRATVAERLRGESFGEFFPTFSRMLTSKEGDVWLEEYAKPGATESVWDIFEGGRSYTGSVVTSTRLRLLFVSRDAVAGVWRDDLDAEYVRVYSR